MQSVSANNPGLGTQLVTEGIQHLGPVAPREMVLTTPFCPYGPMLTNQIQSVSEQAAEVPVKVTVLPDKWAGSAALATLS